MSGPGLPGGGARVWAFPDGELPPPGEGEPHGHESLVILNMDADRADILLDFYFPDAPPRLDVAMAVEGRRVRCVRLDEPVGDAGYRVPQGQYALRVRSSVPVVCQFGRMDVRQPNLAYYAVMGHPIA